MSNTGTFDNPKTNFLINTGTTAAPIYIDLSSIFQPLFFKTTTQNNNNTNYVFTNSYNNNNYDDLSTIFAPYISNTTQANETGYKISNGNDLNTVFMKYDVPFIVPFKIDGINEILTYSNGNFQLIVKPNSRLIDSTIQINNTSAIIYAIGGGADGNSHTVTTSAAGRGGIYKVTVTNGDGGNGGNIAYYTTNTSTNVVISDISMATSINIKNLTNNNLLADLNASQGSNSKNSTSYNANTNVYTDINNNGNSGAKYTYLEGLTADNFLDDITPVSSDISNGYSINNILYAGGGGGGGGSNNYAGAGGSSNTPGGIGYNGGGNGGYYNFQFNGSDGYYGGGGGGAYIYRKINNPVGKGGDGVVIILIPYP